MRLFRTPVIDPLTYGLKITGFLWELKTELLGLRRIARIGTVTPQVMLLTPSCPRGADGRSGPFYLRKVSTLLPSRARLGYPSSFSLVDLWWRHHKIGIFQVRFSLLDYMRDDARHWLAIMRYSLLRGFSNSENPLNNAFSMNLLPHRNEVLLTVYCSQP